MYDSASGDITRLLRVLRSGDRGALDRLLELIYPELRKLAARQLRDERRDHTLQPTAVVNEAYLRLVAHDAQTWQNRSHFFGAAATVMRRVLIDHARASRARKRGGGQPSVALDEDVAAADGPSVDVLALDAALTDLEQRSARQARIVELRYFTGLSVPETAEALQVNPRTVDRDWAAARAWLRLRLGSGRLVSSAHDV